MFKEQALTYTEHVVQRGPYHMYAREYPGEDPPIVLMHGFPDNLHLYDRLVPWLSPSRRVVTFDFLGWGESSKPAGYLCWLLAISVPQQAVKSCVENLAVMWISRKRDTTPMIV
jgi:pimeloyl-ACP methyl ester carboxylesterase